MSVISYARVSVIKAMQNVLICGMTAIQLSVGAVQPADGFFYGVEMEPVGNASITTVETEPAVVLVFATDQKTADITRQFEEWYANAAVRPDINVYAIGVGPADLSREIVLEAINQRNLTMPVFLATSDMLLGDDFRLLLINDDQEIERLTRWDIPALHAAISKIGITVPAATPAPAAPASPAPPAVPAATPVPVDPAPMVSPTPSSELLGGKSRDNIYRNEIYGFTVEFPPLWQYQVAARADGAVAVEPHGSKIDMCVWAVPAEGIANAQAYVDQRLETMAQKYKTRLNVERRFVVREDGLDGLDITYAYTLPVDPAVPARGGLLHRGRMQVYVDDGYIKAAGVEAPSGEFSASYPMVESFFRSFQIQPGDNPDASGYNSPIL